MEVRLKKSWQNLARGDTIKVRDNLALEMIRQGVAEPVREEREQAISEPMRTAEGD